MSTPIDLLMSSDGEGDNDTPFFFRNGAEWAVAGHSQETAIVIGSEDTNFDDDDDDDSSIEVLESIVTPRRQAMNSRHFDGRQRPLEAIRSRNLEVPLFQGSEKSETDLDDIKLEDGKISHSLYNMADSKFSSVSSVSDESRPNIRAAEGTERSVSQPSMNDTEGKENAIDFAVSPKESANGRKRRRKVEARNNEMMLLNKGSNEEWESAIGMADRTQERVETNIAHSIQTKNQTGANGRKKFGAQKSSPSTNRKPKINDKDFDNLYMNGKRFILWTGIADPSAFLEQAMTLVPKVKEWRVEQQEPPLKDPGEFLRTLRRQVRDILKSIDATYKSHKLRKPSKKEEKKKKKKKPKQNQVVEPEDPDNEIDTSRCMQVVPSLSKRFLNKATGLPVYQFAVYDNDSSNDIYKFRVEAKPSQIPNAGNGAFLTYLGAVEARFTSSSTGDHKSHSQHDKPRTFTVVGENILVGEKTPLEYVLPTSLPPSFESAENITVDKISTHPWSTGGERSHYLDHYVEKPERDFCTNNQGCGPIDLGPYAPFMQSDRKTLLHYEIKNFVFSNEPSEWGFEIDDDIGRFPQVADITDDETGMPHDVAKQNIFMYVNETGGDPGLKQTVWSKQVEHQINYFFKTEKAMKKGDTIELLVSYFGKYDEIRERKGYGKKNKTGEIRSDAHYPTFLERNFVERFDMVEVIYSEINSVVELYGLLEFLDGIRGKLSLIVEVFVEAAKSCEDRIRVPFAQQIIALRRLNWLKPYFVKKIESFRQRTKKSGDTLQVAFDHCLLQQCVADANCLDWDSWPALMNVLDDHPNLNDMKGFNLRTKFREEVTEDICYGVNTTLLCPCNESIWCDFGIALTHDLCYAIARDRWSGGTSSTTKISNIFIANALKASAALHNVTSLENFLFDADIINRCKLREKSEQKAPGKHCVMLLEADSQSPETQLPVPVFVEVNLSAEEQSKMLPKIHKSWYLARQILFLVDVFAKKYMVGENSYSMEMLSERLGISFESAKFFVNQRIELDEESNLFYGKNFPLVYKKGNHLYVKKTRPSVDRTPLSTKSKIKKKPRSYKKRNHYCVEKARPSVDPIPLYTTIKMRKPRSSSMARLLFWNLLMEKLKNLNWTIEIGNRPNDFYILPPGVQRGKGFKPRVDFFDSVTLVLNCLKTDTRYCNLPEIVAIREEYTCCVKLFEQMQPNEKKDLKKLSDADIVDRLKILVKESGMSRGGADVLNAIEETRRDPVVEERKVSRENKSKITIILRTQKLGTKLVKESGGIVVKGCTNPDIDVKVGDRLVAVGGNDIDENETLPGIKSRFENSGRPVILAFERVTHSK